MGLINFLRLSGLWILSGGVAGIAVIILIAIWTLCKKKKPAEVFSTGKTEKEDGISPRNLLLRNP